jgi:hypothetical protein
MGKVIQFPLARAQPRRHHAAVAFDAFRELASLERAQLKLFALCTASVVIITGALQLAFG